MMHKRPKRSRRAMSNEILLDYPDFEKCIHLLEQFLIDFAKYNDNINMMTDIKLDLLDNIPVDLIKDELTVILYDRSKNIINEITDLLDRLFIK